MIDKLLGVIREYIDKNGRTAYCLSYDNTIKVMKYDNDTSIYVPENMNPDLLDLFSNLIRLSYIMLLHFVTMWKGDETFIREHNINDELIVLVCIDNNLKEISILKEKDEVVTLFILSIFDNGTSNATLLNDNNVIGIDKILVSLLGSLGVL